MTSGSLIDTLIGMSLFFGALSLCSSALVELWATVIDRRAKQLQVQLKNMMGDEWLKQFMDHPLIKGIREEDTLPSYIEPALFRQALLDMARTELKGLSAEPGPAEWVAALTVAIGESQEPEKRHLLSALRSLLQQEAGDMTAVNRAIETWFNQCMQRASAWYKRNSQLGLIYASSVMVIALNADALQNFNAISTNPALRAALVEHAAQVLKDTPDLERQLGGRKDSQSLRSNLAAGASAPLGTSAGASAPKEQDSTQSVGNRIDGTLALLDQTRLALSKSGFLVGWGQQSWQSRDSKDADNWQWFGEIVLKVFGLLVSILAASLGADFWFSMISRLLPLRSVGRSPQEEQSATQPNSNSRRAQ